MGSGRAAGFYRQMQTKADPDAAREAREEAEREERRRQRWEAKMKAAQEERERERREQRGDHREENGGEKENVGGKDNQGSQQRQREHQQPAPAGRRWREECEDQRRSGWAEYDEAFTAFWDGCFRTGIVDVKAIPLPPVGHSPIAPAANLEEWHRNVRKAELRWHPDKWAKIMRMLGDGEEAHLIRLKQLCERLFRSVVMCKERGFRAARAAPQA